VLQLLLSLTGLGVAGYLSWNRLRGTVPVCVGLGRCDVVQASPYAQFAGIPIAYLGVAAYAGVLALVLYRRRTTGGAALRALLTQLGIVLAATLYSAWLTYLELYVIRAVCPWCVASALIFAGLLVLTVGDLARVVGSYPAHGGSPSPTEAKDAMLRRDWP